MKPNLATVRHGISTVTRKNLYVPTKPGKLLFGAKKRYESPSNFAASAGVSGITTVEQVAL